MYRINITSINDKLTKSLQVGEGNDAICYRDENDRVYKMFRNIRIAKEMTKKTLFNDDADDFSSLTNDSIHTPDSLVVDDKDIILGYSYPYVDGIAIAKMSEDITVLELFENYNKLLEDIQKISDCGFYIKGIHRDNILFDKNNFFHIIDLDNSCFMKFMKENSSNLLYNSNCNHISKSIINNIFGKEGSEELYFKDELLNQLYRNVYCGDIKIMRSLIDYISSSTCGENNPKIATLRKQVVLNSKSKKNVF